MTLSTRLSRLFLLLMLPGLCATGSAQAQDDNLSSRFNEAYRSYRDLSQAGDMEASLLHAHQALELGMELHDAAFSGDIESFEPSTGNYDQSWLAERQIHNRTSQIIDPPDGKFPPRTEAAIAAARDMQERFTRRPDSYTDRGLSELCADQ